MRHEAVTLSAEWEDTLKQLKERNAGYKEFNWFLELGRKQGDEEILRNRRPRVILLGTAFPDEIVRALKEQPMYLLGGSFALASLAEHMVPRDTDSAIKSILGMLTHEEIRPAGKAVVLVPLISDSMRKLCDLLSGELRVIPYEVPNDRNDPLQAARYTEEIFRVTRELEKFLWRPLTGGALARQIRLSKAAAEAFHRFDHATKILNVTISGSGALFIANSYHWCEDKQEWADHLNRLTDEMERRSKAGDGNVPHYHILLMGSPVYAPNYKVPFLIEEMGLETYSVLHPDYAHLMSARDMTGSRDTLIRALADRYLHADMSPAFVENEHLSDRVRTELEFRNIHGIVSHILKGQIEYDFEQNRLESMIDAYEVPVFRLETDYNYQDVEQLRIRLEAFAEMLSHRAKRHTRSVSASGQEEQYA